MESVTRIGMLKDSWGIGAGEPVGVAGRPAIITPHMAMGDAGPGLVRRMGGFHLLGHGDRHRRIVGLGRQGPSDRDADDAGLRHAGASTKSAAHGVSPPKNLPAFSAFSR